MEQVSAPMKGVPSRMGTARMPAANGYIDIERSSGRMNGTGRGAARLTD